jgi:hypothetical protein
MRIYTTSDDFLEAVFVLKFSNYGMVISDIHGDKVTKQYKPLFDFKKQSKLNLLWDFKDNKVCNFLGWKMSNANQGLMTRIAQFHFD